MKCPNSSVGKASIQRSLVRSPAWADTFFCGKNGLYRKEQLTTGYDTQKHGRGIRLPFYNGNTVERLKKTQSVWLCIAIIST